MVPCGSPLAAQIGFQVANLSKDNYKSVAKELYEVPTFPNWSCEEAGGQSSSAVMLTFYWKRLMCFSLKLPFIIKNMFLSLYILCYFLLPAC
jgi:hypothetical protein